MYIQEKKEKIKNSKIEKFLFIFQFFFCIYATIVFITLYNWTQTSAAKNEP